MAEKKKAAHKASSQSSDALCDPLWTACLKWPRDKYWFQEDFLDLKIIPEDDVHLLHACITWLSERHLLRQFTKDGLICWQVATSEEAKRFQNLSPEEEVVYSLISNSGREGIWHKTIRIRTNLHEAVCKRCLKGLESKRLIKSFHNARQPRSKFWILSDLQPSESVTGGLFYADGELDEEFVRHLARFIEKFVQKRSWYRVSSKDDAKTLGKARLSREEAESARAEGLRDGQGTRSKLLPMPPGYTGYPTLAEITRELNQSNIAKEKLKETEVTQILDLLCWDDRIEKVLEGRAYKSTFPATTGHEIGRSALSEAPCGRCPVFDFCDESGPVNARTCTYFQDWLAL